MSFLRGSLARSPQGPRPEEGEKESQESKEHLRRKPVFGKVRVKVPSSLRKSLRPPRGWEPHTRSHVAVKKGFRPPGEAEPAGGEAGTLRGRGTVEAPGTGTRGLSLDVKHEGVMVIL